MLKYLLGLLGDDKKLTLRIDSDKDRKPALELTIHISEIGDEILQKIN